MFSRQEHVSDGTLLTLDMAIGYIKRSDISVTLDGVLTNAWSWIPGQNTIRFDYAIPSGIKVVVSRTTQRNKMINIFDKGASFTNRAMDTDFDQLLYLAQEYLEGAGFTDLYSDLDMHGFRVRNLGDGTDPKDAVNLSQLTPALQDAAEAKALAKDAVNRVDLTSTTLLTYDALRAYSGSAKAVYISDYGVAPGSVSGTGASGRGQHGWFVQSPHLSGFDDNGGTLLVDVLGRRWHRQFDGFIEVDWFGAYGAADSSGAIQRAIDTMGMVGSLYNGGYIAFRADEFYTVNKGVTWNSAYVGIEGRGAYLWALAMPSATPLLRPVQTRLDPNERTGAGYAHPVRNLRVRGGGFAASQTALLISDETTFLTNVGNNYHGVTFQGFKRDVFLGRGCFFTSFDRCSFQLTHAHGGGDDGTPSIEISSGPNSGERNTFTGCMHGGRKCFFRQSNGTADTYFYDNSFDFPQGTALEVQAGGVFVIGGHSEGDKDLGPFFSVSGDGGSIHVSNHEFILGGHTARTLSSLAYSSPGSMGITITDSVIRWGPVSSKVITVPIVGGDGPARVSNITWPRYQARQISSYYCNLLYDGGFNTDMWADDWKVPVGTRTSAYTPAEGTHCLAIKNTTSAGTAGHFDIPCKAGDTPVIQMYTYALTIQPGAHLYITAQYINRGGKLIPGSGWTVRDDTSSTSGWELTRSYSELPAPRGAAGVRYGFSVFGTTSGESVALIDAITVTNT